MTEHDGNESGNEPGPGKGTTAFPKAEWIWSDGRFLPWDEATIHVMSHVVHYGSSVIEGIRSYGTSEGHAIFRLGAHVRRFYESCRIYRMRPAPTRDQLAGACHEIVERNGLADCYIRPVALRGMGAAGLHPAASPVETFVIAWPWGTYLGQGSLDRGVRACVSSWFRPAPNTHPSLAKAGGNYLNGQLMKMEARDRGFDEAIALGTDGTVSEGSGQNIFLVRDGELLTSPLAGTILAGITRDAVIRIAGDLGLPVRETPIPRELLYVVDEAFFTGTASEITPIRSVDDVEVGSGGVGPLTRRIQERFFGIVRGEVEDIHGWLDRPTSTAAPVPAGRGDQTTPRSLS